MTNLIFSTILILCYGGHLLVDGKPTGANGTHEAIDSYAIVPSKQQQTPGENLPENSELSLDMVPPAVLKSASPHIFYMNSDGMAESAETEEVPQRRRRNVGTPITNNPVAPISSSSFETMKTAETIIIQPPSNRRYAFSGHTLGFRPSHASYNGHLARWKKYPWNYH